MSSKLALRRSAIRLLVLSAARQPLAAQTLAPRAVTLSQALTNGNVVSETNTISSERRQQHAVVGGMIGAAAGGIFGFYAHQKDRTGEGLIAPVMIGAGALAGALAGTVVGLLWPAG